MADRLGGGIGGIIFYILFPAIRISFYESIRTIRKAAFGVIFLNEGIFVLAKSLTYYAYSIGPTALVSIVGNSQAFFGILYGGMLSLIAPHIFQENVTIKALAQKIIFAIILFIGAWLIY